MANSNNRRRSRSKGAARRRRIIFLLSALCVLSIAVGVAMAATACSEDSDAQPNIPNPTDPDNPSPTILHYANLDSVAIPSSVPSQVKQYEGFKLSFNKDNKTPNWVAWELLGSEVGGEQERYNKFWQDYDLEGCPSTSDYTHSGYDRGHMCPAADQKWSYDAMVDCFVMANMCPQDHSLNAGAWTPSKEKSAYGLNATLRCL